MKTFLEKIDLPILTNEYLEISIKILDILFEILNKKQDREKGFWYRFKNNLPKNYNVTIQQEDAFEIIFTVYSSQSNLYQLFEKHQNKKGLELLEKLYLEEL